MATPLDPSTVPSLCGDIDPTMGITGSPVIDPARDELFVVATEQVPGGASHHLIGLDLYTGALLLDEDIDPASVVAPAFELQRVSLALTDGRVIIGMGGNAGDCGTYHGLVISAPEDGSAPSTYVVADEPGDNQGAVWMGGSAPDIDARGTCGCPRGTRPPARPPTPRTASSSCARRCSSSTPSRRPPGTPTTTATPTSPPRPPSCSRTAWSSRSASRVPAYVLNGAHLGGIGGQEAESPGFCGTDPDGGSAVVGGTVYVPCGDGLRSVTPVADTPPVANWTTSTGAHSSPISAGGMIWSIGGSTLYALDPKTGDQDYQPLHRVAHHPLPVARRRPTAWWWPRATDQLFAFDGPAGLPGPPTPAPTRPGYWMVASDGGIFSFGGSSFYGSTGGIHLNAARWWAWPPPRPAGVLAGGL